MGFVGALSRVSQSFHDLGVGDLPGRYVVLRSPSSAMVHDAVERSYAELSEEERRRVQKDARRHRAAAVFLHELGHTLGALHERSDQSLMYPEYRARMTTFSPEATLVMRGVLGRRDFIADQLAGRMVKRGRQISEGEEQGQEAGHEGQEPEAG